MELGGCFLGHISVGCIRIGWGQETEQLPEWTYRVTIQQAFLSEVSSVTLGNSLPLSGLVGFPVCVMELILPALGLCEG